MKGKTKEPDSYSTSLLSEGSDYYDNPEFSSSKSSRNWDKDRDFERYDKYSSPPNFSMRANWSAEIKNQEQVAVDGEKQTASAAICRICFEHDGDELIAPCACKGTNQFVHRSCLDNWRSVKEGYAFSHCTTCKAQFHLHINFLEGSCWRTAKFRMFVARDIIIVFLAVQMIISMLGGLTYLCDIHGKLIKLIDHGWGHPVFFYYCCGAILTLALLGIVGLIAQCSPCCETVSYNSGHSSSGQTSVYCFNCPMSVDFSSSGSDSDGDCWAVMLVLVVIVVIVFAAIGIFYGIFAGSILLQRIWQRHYHILTKKALTKEYVVQDLHGNYTPPKLDEEHAKRLRMLNLF